MTADNFADIMAKRMTLVEKLSALNSRQLSNTQTRSGIEVELQSCIEDIERRGETDETLARRIALEKRLQAAVDACADCDRDRQRLTDELDGLDQQLQQAGPAS